MMELPESRVDVLIIGAGPVGADVGVVAGEIGCQGPHRRQEDGKICAGQTGGCEAPNSLSLVQFQTD